MWRFNRAGIDDLLLVDSFDDASGGPNLASLRWSRLISKGDFIQAIREESIQEPLSAVIHMGACSDTQERDENYLEENNVRYTCDLAEWCVRRDVRFIYASSAATYGDGSAGFDDDPALLDRLAPLNPYGRSKHRADLRLSRAGHLDRVVGLKFFNVFGPNEYHKGEMRSFALRAFEQIHDTGGVRLYRSHRPGVADGMQTRDFVYVKDCVDVIWWLIGSGVTGLYNVGTGRERTWLDLASSVFRALDLPPRIDFVDMPAGMRDAYQYHTRAEVSRLRAAGWEQPFRSLEAAVGDYVRSYLAPGLRHLSCDAHSSGEG